MATTIRARIGTLLGEVGASGAFSARRTAPADDLELEVEGLGRLLFPVSGSQGEALCRLAQPARFGRGEETLLDRRVRDTSEIPKDRVKIDQPRWDRTLLPVLERLRSGLGLPDGCRLRADLHSLLVYAPGQFFLPHQDSEKGDEMVATLVVTLPATFQGGALVVEHRGKRRTYGPPKPPSERLSFVAFYADCRHEVRPVAEGHRIVLTYNLMLEGDGAAAAAAVSEASPGTVEALAGYLREHFETPPPAHGAWPKDAPPREPPSRLVYLLDHQYTERGFGWDRLKGDDGARVATLRAAAERAGCEAVLALAEIQETWDCFEPGWNEPWRGHRRGWTRDEDEDWIEDEEPPDDDPDAYELGELLVWSITLDRWIDASGTEAERILSPVGDDEVCATTPSSALAPYRSEYEGYMGNYGNTMDRWYRRAAFVLWPRERAFAVRAEASAAWALATLERRLRAGEVAEAREMASALLPIWSDVVSRAERLGVFARALRVAHGLERAELAAPLLAPFGITALTPAVAAAFAAIVGRYGEDWARSLVSGWSNAERRWERSGLPERPAWLAALPRLMEALCIAEDSPVPSAARLALDDSWRWLEGEIAGRLGIERPSLRDDALSKLASPLLSFLESAALVGTADLLDAAVAHLCSEENELLLPTLVRTLRAGAERVAPALWPAAGFEALAGHCARLLQAQLAEPARGADDWSITLPEGCRCALCKTLGAFLADPGVRRREWPLAKDGRKHVHRRLDACELPVRHETRRTGRPFTLVLTKTRALFEREAAARRAREADLAWLTGESTAAP